MSAIPPKQMPEPTPYEAPETGGGLVAMYNAASHAGAESFPVLKAFQDYIEAERSQARKRVIQLSVFFAALMVVVVGGFLTAGIAMWRSNDERVNKLLEAVIQQRAAPPTPAAVPATVVQTSPVLEESMRQMSRVTTELQASLGKKLDGVSDIATQVHEKVASQDGELDKMREELKKMQERSAKLQTELASVKAAAKKPAPPPAMVAPPAAPAVTATAPTVTAAPAVAVAPTALAAAAPAAKPVTAAAPPAPPVKPEPRDPRFPAAVKDPPVTPAGVAAPDAPTGMMASAIPLKTRNVGTIPWRVLIPE